MKRFFIFTTLAMFTYAILQAQDKPVGMLRFPTISQKNIVFTYSGDLYTVEKNGGTARKLTSDVGYEMFAKFSPDEKSLAFTGQYDGNTEVFVMPAQGGIPKRVTFTPTLQRDDITDRMGPNNIVVGWKDNGNIIFRSRMKSFNDFTGQLFVANINGGLPSELPFLTGGFSSLSPDGKQIAFSRVFREFRTWKYYKGGMANDIWIYNFETHQSENITNNVAQDIFPMWSDNKIYFISDRDRIMNLFVYDLSTKATSKLTNFDVYDIKFPSMGKDEIVFENGGFIHVFDIKTGTAKKLDIFIADDNLAVNKKWVDASKNINGLSVSPDAMRITASARGDIFTLPASKGITRNLTATSGVHERNAIWSPNGKYIAYISDESGEDEIYIIAQDGKTKATKLTNNGDTYKFQIKWSPDSKKILWSDKKLRLQYVDIETKKVTQVAQSKVWEYNAFNWSPDSKWIAYSEPSVNEMSIVFIYKLETGKAIQVTSDWYSSTSPVFSKDGKYLFFTSDRDFDPIYSATEWNHAYVDMSGIYFVTLQKSTPSPFKPKNDEVNLEEKSTEPESKKQEAAGSSIIDVVIDFDGIEQRIERLPIEAATYYGVQPADNSVFYMRNKYGDEPKLLMYDLEKQKETVIGRFNYFQIAANGKKMLLYDNNRYAVIDLPRSEVSRVEDYIELTNMDVLVDLKQEWRQIFTETWRQMKYFFYDPEMHGLDWNAVHKKYEPLLEYVHHRNDLTYVLGEMIGELNVGHAYVGGGDREMPEKIEMGLLGAGISKDNSGFYKIEKILNGQNWTNDIKSPLQAIGVNAKVGDYIIAIDGKSVKSVNNIFELLINKANKPIEILLSDNPSEMNAHTEIVVPIADESQLYYYNWVQDNIAKVDKAANGQVGYIHIPDMGVGGLNEFVKYFYPQLNKKALIIDDRGNGGGNVSPMIIERLRRELTLMQMSRNTVAKKRPQQMMAGPKVLLMNEYSASDGDLFPYQFKTLKLGKTIGTRTWGGVVGIRGSLPFIDGATLSKPEFAHFDREGKGFIIEGWGVEPDIEVINDPYKEYMGEDQQLNKAIEVILEDLKNYNHTLPEIPDFPDKSK